LEDLFGFERLSVLVIAEQPKSRCLVVVIVGDADIVGSGFENVIFGDLQSGLDRGVTIGMLSYIGQVDM